MNVGFDTHLERTTTNKARQADIVDLYQFLLEFLGQHPQRCVVPDVAGPGFWGKRKSDDRHIIDTPSHHQRHRNTRRNSIKVRPDLFMHTQNGIVSIRAHIEARGDQRPIVPALRIDMLDVRYRFDDFLKRFRYLLNNIRGTQSRCRDDHVDHGHGYLWFFFARDGQ